MSRANIDEGFEDVVFQLTSLITAYSPPFIFIHDPTTPHLIAPALHAALRDLQASDFNLRYACADIKLCYHWRILFDTILNALAQWEPTWEEGCNNWEDPFSGQGQRFNDSFDAFLHGIRAIWNSVQTDVPRTPGNDKGKARTVEPRDKETRFIILLERAEQLKEIYPDLMAPIARLGELSRTEITVILLSDNSWQQLKPPMGYATDPFYIDVRPLSKQSIINRLASAFPLEAADRSSAGSQVAVQAYHPALRSLYRHYISVLYSICSPFTTDPDELAYIAAARWPGFVQPILDDHQRRLDEHRTRKLHEEGHSVADSEEETNEGTPELQPPSEDVRIRLTRLFTPSFTAALEALYPRLTFAEAWARANIPDANLLNVPPRQMTALPVRMPEDQDSQEALKRLPRVAKFIVIASFICSTNPAKTDMRMFGRGLDERAKRRRKGGSPRKKSTKTTAVKIPQRLLGPLTFPLDRMIAVLGVLLEENDADARPPAPEYKIPGEYTEIEISRVAVLAQVLELASSHLLHRVSTPDALNTNPTFKCGVGYEAALGLARDVGVNLHDLLWDPL